MINDKIIVGLIAACPGPGYKSPRAAMLEGLREKLLYVIGIHTDPEKADVLCTVDVDPASPTYCQVHHLFVKTFAD